MTSASALAPDDVVVVRGLGKSLSLPQLRLGVLSGLRRLLDACARTLEWDCLRVNLPAQEAARAVLAGPREWLGRIHRSPLADREAAVAAVAAPGLTAVTPAAASFLFVRAEAGGEVAAGLARAGLPVVDGAHFKEPGYARLPFGGAAHARADLEHALARWAALPAP